MSTSRANGDAPVPRPRAPARTQSNASTRGMTASNSIGALSEHAGGAAAAAGAAGASSSSSSAGTSVADRKIVRETFEASDFNCHALLEQIMENDVKQASVQGGSFDPAPHIKTLEHALSLLLPLRRANAAKTAELERQVASAERVYRNDVRAAKAGFETVYSRFQALESRISDIGRTAVRIGEQIESLDRLRQRASEAHDLILYYNEFAAGDTSRLETMRKEGGKEGRAKVAVAARRLLNLSREVDGIEGAEQTRATIEKYCEKFEKDMLRLFDRYYRKGDPKAMAHCAKTLQDFNGGKSCIQIYVNQHDFFISKDRIQDAASGLVSSEIWEPLPDPDAPPPKAEPGLTELFSEIRVTVDQEAQIITAVFPSPPAVMQTFLQRVFAQVIQAYIETLIHTASSSSTLAYLRILHLSRSLTVKLVEDLKSHEFFRSSPAPLTLSTASGSNGAPGDRSSGLLVGGLPTPTATTFGAGHIGSTAVSAMLDQALDELFVPYMEGTRYLDKESKSLTELYASKLLRFTNYHRAMNKAKPSNTIFDRMVNQLTAAAKEGVANMANRDAESAEEESRLDRLMKLSGMGKDKRSSGDGGDLFDAVDGELDLMAAEKMLKWHAEAIGRVVELSSAGDVPKSAFSLLKVLADSFGRAYVETALDTAIHQLSLYDSKLEPDLKPMLVVRKVDLIVQLWQNYVTTALVPLVGTSVTMRREMTLFNSQAVARIESKANAIVQRVTDITVSWLTAQLAKQKRGDFKPRNDDIAFSRANTEPCMLCCDFLAVVRETAASSLSGKNAEGFLTEIGVTFHTLLLDHLKKFQVSATGGLVLTKDLAMYQDTIATFSIPTLNDRYEMLRQLGNVFIVQPDILKAYLNESYLARIENSLLRPYVMQRADYGDLSRRFWDDVFNISMPTPVAGDAAERRPSFATTLEFR